VDSKSFDGTATVTYTFFKGLSCTPGAGNANVIDTDQVTVAQDGTVPKSDNHGPLGAGDYSFQASYSGNADYNTKTSDCEPFSVNKAGSSTATEIHNVTHQAITSAALGSTVHDKATVTSANTSFKPTGAVTFTFWRGTDSCPDPATSTADEPAGSLTLVV